MDKKTQRWEALVAHLKTLGPGANEIFGKKIGKSENTIVRYKARMRRPDDDTLLDIERESGGAVPATSWISELVENERAA